MIGLCLIWLFLDNVAMASISLKLNNTLTDCENGYIEIRCIIDSTLVKEIISVSLRRFDGEDVSVLNDSKVLARLSKGNNVFVDTEIANRSGVGVISSISDSGLSNLSIRIMGSVVKPMKDSGLYQCCLMGFTTKYALIIENSTLEMLNITDFECFQSTPELRLRNSISTVETQETQSSKNTNADEINIG
uniref:Uncharacterized protein LOC111106195 n=1 Tax=Crassostrea virginica TaxID=6565 RepID=A0A8B8AZ79_CRAVI|nr:uncharacterized protein LOC111106195 [Crassostrea virginica]